MSERISPIFFGTVQNGKIVLDNESSKKRFRDRLILLEGKQIQLLVNKRYNKRSVKQNDFYWGAIIPLIADQVGMLDEEVHNALRWKFLSDNTKTLPTAKSTTELSKGEFVDYILHIQVWASEFLGIEQWPDPEAWSKPVFYD